MLHHSFRSDFRRLKCTRRSIQIAALIFIPALATQCEEHRSASVAFEDAMRFADLYNWADAGPKFEEAEELFLAAGDKRNALYANLGKVRSNIQRAVLPAVSSELADELDTNAILQTDKQVRMFCLIVKGDIDAESNHSAMRRDWDEVLALARELHDSKWENRALAQLGIAAYFDGDIETARKNVGIALMSAATQKDIGGQIFELTALGTGLVESRLFEQALPYCDRAIALAKAHPAAGYPFMPYQVRLKALIGLKRYDAAQALADEMLQYAREGHGKALLEAAVLGVSAHISEARGDDDAALAQLLNALQICRERAYLQQLPVIESEVADLYRRKGSLNAAEESAATAVKSTQAAGDVGAIPRRLDVLARILVAQGRYEEADEIFDRASAYVDSMVGNAGGVLDKTALLVAASQMYSEHFSLIAEHLHNPEKAYTLLERVRGRITRDLLTGGSVTADEARQAERAEGRLRLRLASARTTADVRRIRDEIFIAQQARLVNPELSIAKVSPDGGVPIARVQRILDPGTVLLEYLVADPHSYCLVLSRNAVRIIRLSSGHDISEGVTAYLTAIRAKQGGAAEARHLYAQIVAPIREAKHASHFIVVRDGPLHLVPFDGLIDEAGGYVVERHTVTYAPSASTFYLLRHQSRGQVTFAKAFLGVGGVPYDGDNVKRVSVTRGYERGALANLPASRDEVLTAAGAIHDARNTLLLGTEATESAFKRAQLVRYGVIHMAVHAIANTKQAESAALVLLSDAAAGEDGLLQASEISRLRLHATLVVLSGCETAVGPVTGEEGIAALSRAFLLAGAATVVSTLWPIEDTSSLFLMRQFYKHLKDGDPTGFALTEAKRDMIRKFGRAASPYYWAGFTLEGVYDRPLVRSRSAQREQ